MRPGPRTMHAVYLRGYGGLDQLEYTERAPVPVPAAGEVLIRVTAAGINNTDINTRTGWYHRGVRDGTTAAGGADGFGVDAGGMGDWSADFEFPRIQGADVAGAIVEVGAGVSAERLGQRVICDPYIRQAVAGDPVTRDIDTADHLDAAQFLGADRDGGFAQYVCVPARNAIAIGDEVPLADSALATLPCSGGTAMNMLSLARVGRGDRMLVTGASGGVGSFLLQIGRHLGAEVIAVAAAPKRDRMLDLGARDTIDRHTPDYREDALAAGCGGPYTVVADVVGGARFGDGLALLKRGGRYVTAGAIAGPVVELDLRALYLKNLAFFGSTVFLPQTLPALVELLRAGVLHPLVDREYPLVDIRQAQQGFLQKNHVGSLVLIPPAD